MNAAYLLVQAVRDIRRARKAIDHANDEAALYFVTHAYKHVGAAWAATRPLYLSRLNFLTRIAHVEQILMETRDMLPGGRRRGPIIKARIRNPPPVVGPEDVEPLEEILVRVGRPRL
jgi:hypothetical protein